MLRRAAWYERPVDAASKAIVAGMTVSGCEVIKPAGVDPRGVAMWEIRRKGKTRNVSENNIRSMMIEADAKAARKDSKRINTENRQKLAGRFKIRVCR
jgi:hypothetical protein